MRVRAPLGSPGANRRRWRRGRCRAGSRAVVSRRARGWLSVVGARLLAALRGVLDPGLWCLGRHLFEIVERLEGPITAVAAAATTTEAGEHITRLGGFLRPGRRRRGCPARPAGAVFCVVARGRQRRRPQGRAWGMWGWRRRPTAFGRLAAPQPSLVLLWAAARSVALARGRFAAACACGCRLRWPARHVRDVPRSRGRRAGRATALPRPFAVCPVPPPLPTLIFCFPFLMPGAALRAALRLRNETHGGGRAAAVHSPRVRTRVGGLGDRSPAAGPSKNGVPFAAPFARRADRGPLLPSHTPPWGGGPAR